MVAFPRCPSWPGPSAEAIAIAADLFPVDDFSALGGVQVALLEVRLAARRGLLADLLRGEVDPQVEVDAALLSIDRIATSTRFRRLAPCSMHPSLGTIS